MSRDPGDPGPPRRARPKAPRPSGANTYRPNPNQRASRPVHDDTREPGDDRRASNPAQVILFGRVDSGTLALFCRQFAAYLDAGVDLIKALTSLETQFARTAMGPVIRRLTLSVRRGDSMTEAVKREPKAFDTLFVSMIQTAEARGGHPRDPADPLAAL